MNEYDAVLVLGFGGPESVEEVVPFLQRVTAGRGIPEERLLEVGQHYVTLGGVSPINEQNRALTAALTEALAARGIALPVVLGNRNSAPFFADVLAELAAQGHRRVLAVPTSAYSSYSGCRQYREDLWESLPVDGAVEVRKLPPFGYVEGFVAPVADDLRSTLDDLRDAAGTLDGVRVFFTTHSLPTSMAASAGPGGSDAYVAQHLDVIQRVLAATGADGNLAPEWSLVYQSRSGPPQMPWLEPDINDAIREVAAEGATSVVLVPIGFVSDHVEVIWDLDTQARQTAEDVGIAFRRVRTPGVDPRFVEALADLVAAELAGERPPPPDPWAGTCGPDCCLNPRSSREAVPGC